MSERDLSTMLRDHLSDEPPVDVRSQDAIRTARRSSNRLLALTGVTAVAVLGLGAGFLPGLLTDDGTTTAHETPGFSSQPSGTYVDRLQSAADDQLGQHIDGGLGTADLWVANVDAEDVPATSPEVQTVVANYDLGDTVVNVTVGGFAPEEFETFRLSCNPGGTDASCERDTLPDGSDVMTQVGTYTSEAGVMRYLGPGEAANHPNKVFWGRSVHVATPSGLDVFVAEYVRAPALSDVQWHVPVEALTSLATDPVVLDPTGVAHSPVCESAHTTC